MRLPARSKSSTYLARNDCFVAQLRYGLLASVDTPGLRNASQLCLSLKRLADVLVCALVCVRQVAEGVCHVGDPFSYGEVTGGADTEGYVVSLAGRAQAAAGAFAALRSA